MILMFLSPSRDKLTLLYQNSVTDVSVGFQPPCWCPSMLVSILHKRNYYDLNLGESHCILTFFLFSDSGLNLLNGFDSYFECRDTENQQYTVKEIRDNKLSTTKKYI